LAVEGEVLRSIGNSQYLFPKAEFKGLFLINSSLTPENNKRLFPLGFHGKTSFHPGCKRQ
ncbi:hypothetical protein Q8G40_30430, partial [Klebsiella pneumoniae]|uniref:hypothetical protein n=1 Tax=Klebsiella pneumoniae TaxID=573 RepID=UPI0030134D2A